MTRTEDNANADRALSTGDQLADEDLEAVAGGLARPLEPSEYEDPRPAGRSDASHDDTADT